MLIFLISCIFDCHILSQSEIHICNMCVTPNHSLSHSHVMFICYFIPFNPDDNVHSTSETQCSPLFSQIMRLLKLDNRRRIKENNAVRSKEWESEFWEQSFILTLFIPYFLSSNIWGFKVGHILCKPCTQFNRRMLNMWRVQSISNLWHVWSQCSSSRITSGDKLSGLFWVL